MEVSWLDPRALKRVRGWLRDWGPERIAWESRTKSRSTTWALATLYSYRSDLIMTGSSAVEVLEPERLLLEGIWGNPVTLKYRAPRCDAYVGSGSTPETWALRRRLLPGDLARVRVNNLPIRWNRRHMPAAVVAADVLETSSDEDDREMALEALTLLLHSWREAH